MEDMVGVLKYGIGTILGFVLILGLVAWLGTLAPR